MERIKQRRLQQMKKAQEQRARWKADGHGEYREIVGEKEFFKEMKGVERMVAHFYRENWPCKVMDKHLDLLAKKHLETKFVKVHAEKFPYLTEKLQIWMLPTLALIRKEKVIDYICGFDDFGGKDDFKTEVLACRLANQAMIEYEGGDEAYGAVQQSAPQEQRSVRTSNWRAMQRTESDEDSDFSD